MSIDSGAHGVVLLSITCLQDGSDNSETKLTFSFTFPPNSIENISNLYYVIFPWLLRQFDPQLPRTFYGLRPTEHMVSHASPTNSFLIGLYTYFRAFNLDVQTNHTFCLYYHCSKNKQYICTLFCQSQVSLKYTHWRICRYTSTLISRFFFYPTHFFGYLCGV